MHPDDRRDPTSFLGNVRASRAHLIRLAAMSADYRITTGPARGPVVAGFVGVYHRDPGRDTGPFWAEYRRLRDEVEAPDAD